MASIYSSGLLMSEDAQETSALVEMFLYDDISRGTEEQIKEFCNSPEAKALLEKGVFKKPTLMRLGKADDLKRREKLSAFYLAKKNKDPLWTKLVKNRKQEKILIAKIMVKYGGKASKTAKVAQKEYVKAARHAK